MNVNNTFIALHESKLYVCVYLKLFLDIMEACALQAMMLHERICSLINLQKLYVKGLLVNRYWLHFFQLTTRLCASEKLSPYALK